MGLFKKKGKTSELVEELSVRDEKKNKQSLIWRLWREKPWLSRGLSISLVCGMFFSGFYGVFQVRAEKYQDSPTDSTESIAWLYQSCYLLYRDLYNSRQEDVAGYQDIYLETKDGYQWILDGTKLDQYWNVLQLVAESETEPEEIMEGIVPAEERLEDAVSHEILDEETLKKFEAMGLIDREWLEEFGSGTFLYNLDLVKRTVLLEETECFENYFLCLESSFRELNLCYDYLIEDHATGKLITNMSVESRDLDMEDQYFCISFRFDSAGNATVGDFVSGRDADAVRKAGNEVIRDDLVRSQLSGRMEVFEQYGRLRAPVDCTVTFSIRETDWKERTENFYIGKLGANDNDMLYYDVVRSWVNDTQAYENSGAGGTLAMSMLILVLLGSFLPVLGGTKPWKEERVCSISLELLFLVGIMICSAATLVINLIAYVASGAAGGVFTDYLGCPSDVADLLVSVLNLSVLTVFFCCCWYVGVCARALGDLGVRGYIRQRSLIYRFFPFMKGKTVDIYDSVAHMDLTRNANKTIIKLLVINGVILFVISCFWVGGFAITVVYSIVLYIILRKYVSELQKRYRILLRAVDQIAAGHLDVVINEDLGVFEPFREQVFKIQDGLQKAVDTEVRSQRMKVELVTNMSHDLKTPLTAIITYINLLKEGGLTEQQRREYIATLERKSLRLKSLIEDLFEFSKASSHNITLNIMDVDIMNLIKQVAFEMSDKLGETGLDVRMNLTEEKVILPLDSQKTYRIYENLFGNIAKYALPGTRVYVNGFRIDDMVVITLKNISAQEITVDSSELTERFVRGDASRNTEGSGLGLAIAKSFTELQGGLLELEVDGDLFKVTTTWHTAAQSSYPEALPNSQ